MKTINKIKQLLRLSDDVLSRFINLSSVDLINETIIVYLMMLIQSDMDALQFCDVVENLIDNISSTIIKLLRNGNLLLHNTQYNISYIRSYMFFNCMFLYMYVCN